MARTDATPAPETGDYHEPPTGAAAVDGFDEPPTGAPLPAAVSLHHLRQVQKDLAALIGEHARLALKTREIEERVTQAMNEITTMLREQGAASGSHGVASTELPTIPPTRNRLDDIPTHSDEAKTPANRRESSSDLPSSPRHSGEYRAAKTALTASARTSIMGRRLFEMVNPKSNEPAPDVITPHDADWSHWQEAWAVARARADSLAFRELPACPATVTEMDDFLNTQARKITDSQLSHFFADFRKHLQNYEDVRGEVPDYAGSQSLKQVLEKARGSDTRTDDFIDRALKALQTWEEKLNARHRWTDPSLFDGELVEALTLAYDKCFAALSEPAMRSVCDWLIYFLSLLGVFKDDALQVGVAHERLPKQLRDKFSPQNMKPGVSADACKVTVIERNRWFRAQTDKPEVQVVRPWYQLG